jgi:photosystem II stability/assembly factor-like uncharacterized protein
MTCPDAEPCPIFLELSSVASAGSRIFLAGDIHSAQTTLYSVLLQSEDGGVTWKEPVGRVRGEALDRIQFQNLESGWVSGQRVVPLTGDPFLMVTNSGGRSWRKIAVVPEGSRGYIQKFRFDSALSGKLMMDRGSSESDDPRYRIYETRDGAETWMAGEASTAPIKNAPVAVDDSLWRVASDKAGKKLLVEHRTLEKWVTAAEFTIQIAECKEQ